MKLLSIITLVSLSLIGVKSMRDIPSEELLKEFKGGWSLGNTLDSECTCWLDYSVDELESETCWGNDKTTEDIFKKLMSTNFNVFRIPTTWTGHFDNEYNISKVWMERVHEVVDYAYKNGAYVILDSHHENWNYAFSNNLSKAKVILEKIWKQIAEEFKEYDERLIFEGFNEPRKVDDSMEWTEGDREGWNFVNEINSHFVKTIRSTGGNNKLRHLLISTYAASINENSLRNFLYPSGDDKVIVSLHAYTPYDFTLNTDEGAVSVFNNPGDVDKMFNLIEKYFISKKIPVLFGEFGAVNRENESERVKWVKYIVEEAKDLGIPCIWWDSGKNKGEEDEELFGIFDRKTYEFWYPDLVKSYLNASGFEYIDNPEDPTTPECWSKSLGYDCCTKADTTSIFTDESGDWGVENDNWCGIIKPSEKPTCWSKSLGYDCCNGCEVIFTDADGKWGVENDNWCGIYKC